MSTSSVLGSRALNDLVEEVEREDPPCKKRCVMRARYFSSFLPIPAFSSDFQTLYPDTFVYRKLFTPECCKFDTFEDWFFAVSPSCLYFLRVFTVLSFCFFFCEYRSPKHSAGAIILPR